VIGNDINGKDNNNNDFYQGECSNMTYDIPKSFYNNNKNNGKFRPYFSWDYFPLFWHGGSYIGINDNQLEYLAKHPFSTIVFEKFEGNFAYPIGAKAENKIDTLTKNLKKLNPRSRVLYYQNTAFNFPNYDIYCDVLKINGTVPQYIFKYGGGIYYGHTCNDAIGNYFETTSITAFDYSKPEMIKLWNKYIKSIMNKKLYSGMFLDRVTFSSTNFGVINGFDSKSYDQNHLETSLKAAIKFPASIIAEYGGNYENKLIGQMYKAFVFGSGNSVDASITSLINDAKEKRIVQVNADSCGPDPGSYPNAGQFSPAVEVIKKKVRIITMAAFLIGACKNSYYSCSVQYRVDVPGSNKFCWYDEYNKPLGAPLGGANIKIHTDTIKYYYRKFSTGTRSFIDNTGNNACICWSDNTSSCYGSFDCTNTPQLFETIFGGIEKLNQFTNDGCA